MAAKHADSNGTGHLPAGPVSDAPARPPRIETAILAGSFVLLWAWFVERQHAYRTSAGTLPFYWNAILLISLVALGWVTIRRLRRIGDALRQESERMRQPPRR